MRFTGISAICCGLSSPLDHLSSAKSMRNFSNKGFPAEYHVRQERDPKFINLEIVVYLGSIQGQIDRSLPTNWLICITILPLVRHPTMSKSTSGLNELNQFVRALSEDMNTNLQMLERSFHQLKSRLPDRPFRAWAKAPNVLSHVCTNPNN